MSSGSQRQHGSAERPRKAVVLGGERLMLPLLADVLRCAGMPRVLAFRTASARTLRRADPQVILIDADRRGATPLELIRSARAATSARIIVITRTDGGAWHALARALGADAILGQRADRHDLLTAVRPC